jgi:hypothetical protein
VTEQALQFLRCLPEVEPPALLWARIERAQARRRFARRAVPVALAASLLVALLMLRGTPTASGPTAAPIAGIDQTIARSHALEGDLATARKTGGAASLSLESELARIDSDLARAYSRRANEVELSSLWNARVAALETLVASHRHPDAIRI